MKYACGVLTKAGMREEEDDPLWETNPSAPPTLKPVPHSRPRIQRVQGEALYDDAAAQPSPAPTPPASLFLHRPPPDLSPVIASPPPSKRGGRGEEGEEVQGLVRLSFQSINHTTINQLATSPSPSRNAPIVHYPHVLLTQKRVIPNKVPSTHHLNTRYSGYHQFVTSLSHGKKSPNR